MFRIDHGVELGQALPAEFAEFKDPGGDDQLLRPLVKPEVGIVGSDAATQLQPAGIGGERGGGRLGIAGTKHDHVAAFQAILPVHPGIEIRPVRRFIVGDRLPAGIGQGGANNLHHLAVPQINAWAKPHSAPPEQR